MKPNTFHLSTALLLSLIGLAASQAFALDITGDTVTTDLTVKGASITFNNNSTTNSSQLRFNSTNRITSSWLNAPGTWVWSHGSTPTDVMSLDSSNVLSLYDLGTASVNPAIILNPGNPSSSPAIAPSISVGGDLVLTASNAQTILTSQGYLRVVGGILNVPSTTSSTSSTTGALTVAGGIGVAKDAYINGVRIGRGNGDVTLNGAFGSGALLSNTTGSYNLAIGQDSLRTNTTGDHNTATGYAALRTNTSGNLNTALGVSAGRGNTTGSENTAIGASALYNNTTGYLNVAIGRSAGRYHEDGTTLLTLPKKSIYIGGDARGKNNSDDNTIVIGTNAIGEGANTTVIGNSNTTKTHLYGETYADALRVTGATVLEGSIIISTPQGDISMGIYE